MFDLEVYESLADVLQEIGDYPMINLGGGFAVAYTREDRPPAAAEYAEAMLRHAPEDADRALRARAARWWRTRA